jgi:hypothetical protein
MHILWYMSSGLLQNSFKIYLLILVIIFKNSVEVACVRQQ